MYCAWRIPAHLRCTQCSILLHLMDICFLTCICLWQISQIQTFLFKVVGPGLVSTSPAFVSSSASHPAGPHGRHAQKNGKSGPHCWGRGGSTQFAQQLETTVTSPPLVGCVVWTYLSQFIPDLATKAHSLRGLLKKTSEFRWETDHQRGFEQLKDFVSTDKYRQNSTCITRGRCFSKRPWSSFDAAWETSCICLKNTHIMPV